MTAPAPEVAVRNARPYDSVLDTIGWTPLIRLHRLGRGVRTPVYGKADIFNPGGSVKDRIGMPIIEAAERAGLLKPGGTIVEGTSGNTGVGLAIAAAMKGYKCIFTMPDKMSQEKVRLLKAFGAEVIVTPTAVAPDHPDNYVMWAKRIAEATPNAILANQFYNQANPDAHYATTGPELWEQTEGRITHFVASAGTGGTVTGVGRYLKEKNPDIQIVCGDPTGSILAELWRQSRGRGTTDKPVGAPYKVEGIGQDKLPSTLDLSVVDDYQTVSDKDAFAMARRLTREEGLFVGGSAGLITHVAMQLARRLDDPNAYVVTFLCDTGERYLSKLYNDEWMRENQLLDAERVTLAQLLAAKAESARDGAPPQVVATAPGALVRQALGLMRLHDVSQLPVMDGERCVGSVTEYHLTTRGLESTRFLDATVGEVMDEPFPTVAAGEAVETVTKLLSKTTPALLVQEGGRVAGIVTRSDMLQFLMQR
ncbi:pyridoxal-phosphate dependent enzyme [Roseisolibacter sp. H3M3-2]|uniref:pyridoxal-phosphate dependent enzyme n=1 Tax=Roseisolibacter sp. H3M3-2 TaxID=3031323 RepID=UPI0023DC75D6|nr:pyridoxal-phosphate dependent enzyme [Roseisolibacter sp. H3M3-2]MDF1502116.1 pyridoxal-phosphate dependent enzyme [Roseisolibacter sp. H3M3-2]